MNNQWMYPEPKLRTRTLHAKHAYVRKWCGCMSLRGGGVLACFIWLGLNLYGTVMSFQSRSPIYSYLNRNALMIQGTICLIFCLVALFSLFALFVNKPVILRLGHRMTWLIVLVFLVDFFVNIIVFGVQSQPFDDWCVGKSRDVVDEQVSTTLFNGTQFHLSFTPSQAGSDLYNCHKLWQDELKFAVVVIIMIAICYIYWALCLWSYTQKQIVVLQEQLQAHTAAAAGMAPGVMMNLRPGTTAADRNGESENYPVEDDQKSLAQWTRELFSRTRTAFSRSKGVEPHTEKPSSSSLA
ncbi:uncharacterized protein BYT42DRAFT_554191 [Radiomyces spectabilis]|uniref:uncharacterized protein n=1 Tax=Radiomyces spectabilis TaxID=64574 RepID=UPI002220A993|nr:uncharacterized protein BYT42DRAFT_554191 [Radiomyces spectabilis]KAI8394315.1 hypothetical protein BYT42DRAFT_554191 [Radiomyces spectabilis]